MNLRSATLLLALASGGAACGGTATLPPSQPALVTVNGALHPAVFPGDTVSWTGFGFGSDSAVGAVFVRTDTGFASAEILEWTDGAVRAVIPADVRSGPSYLLIPGDTLGPIPLFVRPHGSFDPNARPWAAGASLPSGLGAAAAAALLFPGDTAIAALVVLSGGRGTDGSLTDATYLGFADGEGVVNDWRAAPDTLEPQPRRLHAMLGADLMNARLNIDGVAYMVGGMDTARTVLTDVLGIGIASSGAYGLWTPLAALPAARAGTAALVAFGSLYVIGGFGADSLASRSVTTARVNPEGTISGWFNGPPLPEGRAFAAAVVAGRTLYVIGGQRGYVDPDSLADSTTLSGDVFAIQLSERTGSFLDSVWTILPTTLMHPRAHHAAFVLDDALVVVGGLYQGVPSAGESEYAYLGVGGVPGDFQEMPAPNLADLGGAPAWQFAAPVLWNAQGVGRATVIGGVTPAGVTASVWSR